MTRKTIVWIMALFLLVSFVSGASVNENNLVITAVDCDTFAEVDQIKVKPTIKTGQTRKVPICFSSQNNHNTVNRDVKMETVFYSDLVTVKSMYEWKNISHPKIVQEKNVYSCYSPENQTMQLCANYSNVLDYDYKFDWKSLNAFSLNQVSGGATTSKSNTITIGKNGETKYFKYIIEVVYTPLMNIKYDINADAGTFTVSLDPYTVGSGTYNRRAPINSSLCTAGNFLMVNGSAGYSINGYAQYIWTPCEDNLYIFYNATDESYYTIGNSSGVEKQYLIEAGNGTGINETAVAGGRAKGIYNLVRNGSDASPKGNTLTQVGTPGNSSGTFWLGQNFTTGASYNKPAFSHDMTTNFTLSCWFNTTSTNHYGIDMSDTGGTGEAQNLIALRTAVTNEASFIAYIDNNDKTNGLKGTSDILTGGWHLVTGTYNGTLFRIYVNGTEEGNKVNDGHSFAGFDKLYIGASPWGNIFTGGLDVCRWYNRSIPPAEINEWYQNYLGTEGYMSVGPQESLASDLQYNYSDFGYNQSFENVASTFALNLTFNASQLASQTIGFIYNNTFQTVYNNGTHVFNASHNITYYRADPTAPYVLNNFSAITSYWQINLTGESGFTNITTTTTTRYQNITWSYYLNNVTINNQDLVLGNSIIVNATGVCRDNTGYRNVTLRWNNTNYTRTGSQVNNCDSVFSAHVHSFNDWHTGAGTRDETLTTGLDINTNLVYNDSWYNSTFDIKGWIHGPSYTRESLTNTNQTLHNIVVDNCSTLTLYSLNYTVRNELTSALLSSSAEFYFKTWYDNSLYYREFNISHTALTSFGICIYPYFVTLRSDIDLLYNASGYDTREWHRLNYSLTNVTEQINLTLLPIANSTTITIEVVNQDDDFLTNYRVDVYKVNIITGLETFIDSQIVDALGLVYFELNIAGQQYYKFYIYNLDGDQVYQSGNMKIVTTSFTLRVIEEGLDDLGVYNNLYHNLITGLNYDNASTNITATWNDTSNLIIQGCLVVEYLNLTVTDAITLFNSCSTNDTGQFVYNYSAYSTSGSIFAYLRVQASADNNYYQIRDIWINNGAWDDFGTEAIVLVFALLGTLIFGLMLYDVSVAIGVGLFALWIVRVAELIHIDYSGMIGITIALGVVIYVLERSK